MSAEAHSLNNGVYALFNNNSQFLRSKAVRQALSLSVDTSKLRQSLSLSTEDLSGPTLNKFLGKVRTRLVMTSRKRNLYLTLRAGRV
ncbi:hypothetical protein KOY48_04105 [Candidatus Minimicrobia naudis]|uniref:Uncharacterized protein n=1 Tax=Candidatus Minimicrobia naudis TaxID=2841263 RepID=A0A8F1MBL4_9BACT|nr:hypothetical protein KOY48_04105 [Candidatus Minimicrobia naudis]